MADRILITGCRGQLGRDLMAHFAGSGEVAGVDVEEFDVADRVAAMSWIESRQPSLVLNAAAFTDVDRCESEPELAMKINRDGARNVADACAAVGARLVHFSTDYVFSGDGTGEYTETDTPNPKTVYGRTKLAGERAVLDVLDDRVTIIRIAWLYGLHGRNFAKTMIRLGQAQINESATVQPLRVVDDQAGNPTWAVAVAHQTARIVEAGLSGVFHATAAGRTTWYRFAAQIFRILGLPVRLESCTTEEFPRPARRPANSCLANERLRQADLDCMQPWDQALESFLTANREALCNGI